MEVAYSQKERLLLELEQMPLESPQVLWMFWTVLNDKIAGQRSGVVCHSNLRERASVDRSYKKKGKEAAASRNYRLNENVSFDVARILPTCTSPGHDNFLPGTDEFRLLWRLYEVFLN